MVELDNSVSTSPYLTQHEASVYTQTMQLQQLGHLPPSVFVEIDARFKRLVNERTERWEVKPAR